MSLGLKSAAGFLLARPRTIANRKTCPVLSCALGNVSSVSSLDGKLHFPNVCGRHGVDEFVTERRKHIRL